MKANLINQLICPSCKSGIRLEPPASNQQEILSGHLICQRGHRFAITDGVPKLLDDTIPGQAQVKQSFSSKWTKIPDFGYSAETKTVMQEWNLERYGWSMTQFADFISNKRKILDAGMGNGWFTSLCASKAGVGGQVFGIDISDGVIASYKHLAHLPNTHVIQTDLTCLPFRQGFFDFIISHGVLHHTPNTEKSFKYLVDYLFPGGEIAIYVYKKKGPIREFCDEYIRSFTTRMSAEECYKFCEAVTKFGKSLSEQKIEINIPEAISLLDIPAGDHDLQRFFYWNVFKCYWRDTWDFETNAMVNFDWYHPAYAYRHTPEEVSQWFKDCGLEIVHTEVNESGISMRGVKTRRN